MQTQCSKTTKWAGYFLGISALALSVWTGVGFGAPQANSSRPTAGSAVGHPIIWAANARHDTLNTVFKYVNFSDVSGLTFNGNARQAGGLHLLVTQPTTSQAGSVWYSNQVNVAQGFSTSFTFVVVPSSGSSTTADGLAFVIQNSGVSALGGAGSDEGYTGIANSLAVEFDTYLSSGFSDPNNNHVGVQSCGVAANSGDHASSCNLGLQPNPPITIADGKGHKVTIGYFPGASGSGLFSVSIDNQLALTSMVDLSTLLSLNGNDAWVGFTGGTGADFETESIWDWSFSSVGTASGE